MTATTKFNYFDEASRNSWYDDADLNSYYDKAGRISILLRMLRVGQVHNCTAAKWLKDYLGKVLLKIFSVVSSRIWDIEGSNIKTNALSINLFLAPNSPR